MIEIFTNALLNVTALILIIYICIILIWHVAKKLFKKFGVDKDEQGTSNTNK